MWPFASCTASCEGTNHSEFAETIYVGCMSRALSPFESIHAVVCETTVMALRIAGRLDQQALTTAWRDLVQENPVLTGRIEFGSDGLYLVPDPQLTASVTVGRVNSADVTVTPIAFGEPVAGLDVSPRGLNESLVSLVTHHAIADGILTYHWLTALWRKYAQIAGGATIPPADPLPVPASPESLLADRGVSKGSRTGAERLDGIVVHPFRDPVGRLPGVDPFALHSNTTVFDLDETAALLAAAKARDTTLHGLICGAILLAERELLEPAGPLPIGLISHVNIRTRIDPPADAADGTNVQGYSCAQVAVAPEDDPRLIGEEILHQLHTDLDDGVVQQTCLHIVDIIARWASNDNLEPISVSNMGEFETLPEVEGLEVLDLHIRGNAHYAVLAGANPPEALPLSTGRHHAVYSFAGRLHVHTTYPAAVLTSERAQAFGLRVRELLLALDG